MKPVSKHVLTTTAVLVIAAIAAFAVFAFSGAYNFAADEPHTAAVSSLVESMRERSIQVRSESLVVPNLGGAKLILQGAGQYAAMCVGCHLRPGMKNSEIRLGLYPLPPNLSQHRVDPKAAFWAIKHGVKMSAMPAWGASHDDATIWSMVAFLQKLPDMSSEEYLDTVRRAPPDTDMDMDGPSADEPKAHGHEHAHDHDHDHDHPHEQVAAPRSGAESK